MATQLTTVDTKKERYKRIIPTQNKNNTMLYRKTTHCPTLAHKLLTIYTRCSAKVSVKPFTALPIC